MLPSSLRPVLSWAIIAAVVVLCTYGILTVFVVAPELGRKQVLFAGIGIGAAVVVQAVSYTAFGRGAGGLHLFALACIAYTVSPIAPKSGLFAVPTINGAKAWINVGFFGFQPAELAKITFVMTLARYLRFRSNYRTWAGLVPPFFLAFVPLVMILKQPDLGMAICFVPALFAMLFAAGAKFSHLAGVAMAAVLCMPVLWLAGKPGTPFFDKLPSVVKPYQRERVYAMFKDDAATLQRTGFQQHYALTAFGSGGLTGKGVGRVDVGRRVPESNNDMIFALVGEQFGLVGGALPVLLAFVVLLVAGLFVAAMTKDPFGRLTAVGIVTMLGTGAMVNLLVMLRLCPVTGITLPFVSSGGSSLICSLFAVGLLLNINTRRPIVLARDAFEFDGQ